MEPTPSREPANFHCQEAEHVSKPRYTTSSRTHRAHDGSRARDWKFESTSIFAAASPYAATPDALVDAGKELQARGADAILLDCIGSTERHREALRLPIILSNAVVVKALSELLGG